jgi:hypothetical protein
MYTLPLALPIAMCDPSVVIATAMPCSTVDKCRTVPEETSTTAFGFDNPSWTENVLVDPGLSSLALSPPSCPTPSEETAVIEILPF